MSAYDVEEPILESALLAFQLAPTLCEKDARGGERCDWYHGLWPLLRLSNLVITPAHHAEFYRRALDTAPTEDDELRVLVSGAADYSMLAHVLASITTGSRRAEITVVDICETPIILSEWYATRVGHPILACRSDILEFSDDRPFDAICTHAFLGRFPANVRPEIVAKWSTLLRPGGSLITVNRLQTAPTADLTSFTPEQARAFRARVLSHARSLRPAIDFDQLALEECVDRYTRLQGAYPLRTREELVDLFEPAGFRIDQLTWAAIAPGSQHELRGPAVPGSSEYGRIVAIRR